MKQEESSDKVISKKTGTRIVAPLNKGTVFKKNVVVVEFRDERLYLEGTIYTFKIKIPNLLFLILFAWFSFSITLNNYGYLCLATIWILFPPFIVSTFTSTGRKTINISYDQVETVSAKDRTFSFTHEEKKYVIHFRDFDTTQMMIEFQKHFPERVAV